MSEPKVLHEGPMDNPPGSSPWIFQLAYLPDGVLHRRQGRAGGTLGGWFTASGGDFEIARLAAQLAAVQGELAEARKALVELVRFHSDEGRADPHSCDLGLIDDQVALARGAAQAGKEANG